MNLLSLLSLSLSLSLSPSFLSPTSSPPFLFVFHLSPLHLLPSLPLLPPSLPQQKQSWKGLIPVYPQTLLAPLTDAGVAAQSVASTLPSFSSAEVAWAAVLPTEPLLPPSLLLLKETTSFRLVFLCVVSASGTLSAKKKKKAGRGKLGGRGSDLEAGVV